MAEALGRRLQLGIGVLGKSGALIHRFEDERSGQKLGCSVAPMGDFDRDGRADVLLGAIRVAADGDGVAYVRSGRDGRVLATFGTDQPIGSRAYLVESLGDLDSDGVADVVTVCSSEWDQSARVRVYSGKTGKVLIPEVVSRGAVQCVRSAGDWDHDGTPDLLVGATGFARVLSGRGAATILELSSERAEQRHEDRPVPGLYGKAIATLRSTNALLDPVIVVSATDTALWGGTIYFHNGDNGRVRTRLPAAEVEKLMSTNRVAFSEDIHHLGNSLANVGDLDGDGFEELACGVRNVEGAVDGVAFLFSGRNGELLYELRRRHDEVVVIDASR